MKYLFFVFFIFSVGTILCQNNIEDHNLNQEFEKINKEFSEIQSELEIEIGILENKIEELHQNNQEKIDFAGKIIDWSGWLFSLMVIILGIAGWIASNRFSKLDETRKELEGLLKNTEGQLANQIEQIENLKKGFQEEKEIAIKLLFPVMEAQWFNYHGDFEKAISAYKRAQKIKPDEKLIANKLNKLLIERGDYDEAIGNLENLIKKYPNDIILNRRLAEGYRRMSQFDSAESVIEKVLKIDNHPSLHYELGCVRLFLGRYSEAEKSFTNANRFFYLEDGRPRNWVYVNLSIVQHLLNKKKEAEINAKKAREILESRIKTTPNNPQIWSYYGLSYLSGKTNYQKALNAFKQATSLNLPKSLAKSALDRILILQKETDVKLVDEIVELFENYISKNNDY